MGINKDQVKGRQVKGRVEEAKGTIKEATGKLVFPVAVQGSVQRRAFLIAGLAGAVSCAFPHVAFAVTAIGSAGAAGNRRFSVFYKGHRIGAHTVLYSWESEDMRINTEIHLLVKIAFFTVFAFSHRSEETWRDGQLMSLRSETVEHGENLHIEGAATPDGFRVVSKGGPFIAPAATLTSNSLWTPAVLEQETVVDAQHGGIIGVSARKFAAAIMASTLAGCLAVSVVLAPAPVTLATGPPGSMYAGNPDDVPTISTLAVLVTSSDQLDELAYGVVKAVFENLADFRRLHPALSTLDIKDMVPSEAVMPIHPGALKYYREAALVH